MKIVAIVASHARPAHAQMAGGALKRTAQLLGHTLELRYDAPLAVDSRMESEDSAPGRYDGAELVLLVGGPLPSSTERLDAPHHEVSLADAIRRSRETIQEAVAAVAPVPSGAATPSDEQPAPDSSTVDGDLSPAPVASETAPERPRRIVAVTSCPTGIAHTFMAAEALQKAARSLGHEIRVETQGSVGAGNALTPEEIAGADAVVIAADAKVDTTRFAGKPLYMTSTKEAMRAGPKVIETALNEPVPDDTGSHASSVDRAKQARAASRSGPYRHLMTGVSYMLPVVIAGGLSIALAFAIGGIYAGDESGTLAWALSQIGSEAAFRLFVAVLSGFIAYSIADRPGIAAGLIGGYLAQSMGAGFLGGIAAGFLAGYLTRFLATSIRLPSTLEGLKPVLILPFLSSIAVGLLMIYAIAPPVETLNTMMNEWLLGMRGANAILLGVVLGAMMSFDMGGPINKAAYTFAVGLLASKIYAPMAAVMAAGITPPLGVALAALLFRNRFDEEDREAGGAAAVLGLSFITEGAIPFAAKDPLRVIPALVIGSATAGAISMTVGVELLVPHGGIFAVLIPGAVSNLVAYLIAIVAGSLVTTGCLYLLKRPLDRAARPALPSSSTIETAARA